MNYANRYIALFALILFFNTTCFSKNTKFDSLAEPLDNICFSYGDSARTIIQDLYNIAYSDQDSLHLICECLSFEAFLCYNQGFLDPNLSVRIKERLEQTGLSPADEALLLYSLGMTLSANGDYSEAFTTSLRALDEFKLLNNSRYIGRVLNLLGTICTHIKLLGMSEDYYEQGLAYLGADDPEYYRLKSNLYRLYFLQSQTQRAIDSLEILIAMDMRRDNPGALAKDYLNIGAYYHVSEVQEARREQMGNGESENILPPSQRSYDYWMKADSLIQNLDNPRLNATLYQNLGVYHVFHNNNYPEALSYFRLTKHIAEKSANPVDLSSAYQILSQTFDLSQDFDSAYYYLKKHQDLSHKLVPNAKAIEAYQAYVSTFLEASKKELTIAEQRIDLKNKQVFIILAVMLSVVLLALLLIQQQNRKKEREKRNLANRLEHEKKMKQFEKEKQQEILEAKTREITSYSLLLSNKNDILQQILDLNAQMYDNPKDYKNIAKKIDKIINDNFNAEEEWKDFKIHFDQVHPSFFDKLKNHCSDLTEDNLRLCAYFRIGMSTKQIALLLHIVPGSVSTNRYRLKKKLGLQEDDDLDDFIRNI